jgi:LAS superfamily LD-carboxypeptidase LdcB
VVARGKSRMHAGADSVWKATPKLRRWSQGIGGIALSLLAYGSCKGEPPSMLNAGATQSSAASTEALPDATSKSEPVASTVPSARSGTSAETSSSSPKTKEPLPNSSPWQWIPKPHTARTCEMRFGKHGFAHEDGDRYFVDGDDELALVNRSPYGSLDAGYAPSDLVDALSQKAETPKTCEARLCLRKEAAAALQNLFSAMRSAGVTGYLESAFRSYRAQCVTFSRWVSRSSFCAAAEQSAVPGHSQHQLGTAIDLFTQSWKDEGGDEGVFRNGFGCSKGGEFLREHAHEHGWVIAYPAYPEDVAKGRPCEVRSDRPTGINPLTGYRPESWHLRYIGQANAKAYAEAFRASGGYTTLEQWIRQRKGIPEIAHLPMCDGCNCGACASLAAKGECRHADHLASVAVDSAVTLGQAKSQKGNAIAIEVTTQGKAQTTTAQAVPPNLGSHPSALTGVWQLLARDEGGTESRIALTPSGMVDEAYEGSPIPMPAATGNLLVPLPYRPGTSKLTVELRRLGRDGTWTKHGESTVQVDPLSLRRPKSRKVAP